MIINAEISVKYSEDIFGAGLHMKVKFKESNRVFKTKIYKIVVHEGKDKSEFLNSAILFLQNETRIRTEGEDLILDYFKTKAKQLKSQDRDDELKKLLKDIKKLHIQVEVK